MVWGLPLITTCARTGLASCGSFLRFSRPLIVIAMFGTVLVSSFRTRITRRELLASFWRAGKSADKIRTWKLPAGSFSFCSFVLEQPPRASPASTHATATLLASKAGARYHVPTAPRRNSVPPGTCAVHAVGFPREAFRRGPVTPRGRIEGIG